MTAILIRESISECQNLKNVQLTGKVSMISSGIYEMCTSLEDSESIFFLFLDLSFLLRLVVIFLLYIRQ